MKEDIESSWKIKIDSVSLMLTSRLYGCYFKIREQSPLPYMQQGNAVDSSQTYA
jgi:hypothetical protein